MHLRSRMVKPGFFQNESLATLPYRARLCLIALWCVADREGRLEDRPVRLKAVLFPYDEDMDVEACLRLLAEGDDPFIVRYTASLDGDAGSERQLIQIRHFTDHQPIHWHEAASIYPCPATASSCKPLASPLQDSCKTLARGSCQVGIGRGRGNGINTNLKSKKGNCKLTKEEIEIADSVIREWESICPHLPSVKHYKDGTLHLPPARVRKILKRVNELEKLESNIGAYFQSIADNEFLSGRKTSWAATIDWALNPTNMLKVLEGHYAKDQRTASRRAREKTGKTTV